MTQVLPASMVDTDVATTAALTSGLAAKANDNAVVHLTGNETIAGVKTFSSQPVMPAPSMVRLNTANGYGSTNTTVKRFTTTVTNQGTDITYADSATNGATFTINTAGIYAISYSDSASLANFTCGITLNSSQLTTSINSINASNRLAMASASVANLGASVAWIGALAVNDVIRAQADAQAAGTTTATFTIVRIA